MDRQQFWRLLEPVHPKAESFCRKIIGDKDDGDDLYQTSVLAALQKFESLKNHESFKAWLFQIIISQYKNKIRSRWRFRRLKNNIEPSNRSDPRNQLMAVRQLEQIMRKLAIEDKALIVLFEIEGWSINELSSIFNKPEGTIKAKLARARNKMRKELGNLYSHPGRGALEKVPIPKSWAEEKT